jgi:hypothetical protein
MKYIGREAYVPRLCPLKIICFGNYPTSIRLVSQLSPASFAASAQRAGMGQSPAGASAGISALHCGQKRGSVMAMLLGGSGLCHVLKQNSADVTQKNEKELTQKVETTDCARAANINGDPVNGSSESPQEMNTASSPAP